MPRCFSSESSRSSVEPGDQLVQERKAEEVKALEANATDCLEQEVAHAKAEAEEAKGEDGEELVDWAEVE